MTGHTDHRARLEGIFPCYAVRPTRVQINSYPASALRLRLFLLESSLALLSFFPFRCDNTPRLREQDVSSPGNFGNNRRRFHVFHGEWRVSEHLFISLSFSRPSFLFFFGRHFSLWRETKQPLSHVINSVTDPSKIPGVERREKKTKGNKISVRRR